MTTPKPFLEPPAREAARLVWARRFVNERLSVELAERLLALAEASGLGDTVKRSLYRLHADETRHVLMAATMLDRLDFNRAKNDPGPHLRAVADEPPAIAFLREVITGLIVCESVSAARFATVLRATDMPIVRACIDTMLRDELAHAGLGFLLLDDAVACAAFAVGPEHMMALVGAELTATFQELDRTVGLDSARRGVWPEVRPQPANNPGVVEPALDAYAFYRTIERRVVPRLEAHGLPAAQAWTRRWD